ncbi:MAG: monothiol glutaredoxin [Candidatus Midichloriaceae bacterium]|jgi:monothiol glutaredoxin
MTENIQEKIKKIINSNDVVLFMKGTRDEPMCGFSSMVINILKILEVEYLDVNILEDEGMRQGIKDYSDWPTIPQLYSKQEFIGGCDIVKELYQSGELQKILVK